MMMPGMGSPTSMAPTSSTGGLTGHELDDMILAAEADQSDMGMDPTGRLQISGLGEDDPDDDELEDEDDESDSDEDEDEMDARMGMQIPMQQPSSQGSYEATSVGALK